MNFIDLKAYVIKGYKNTSKVEDMYKIISMKSDQPELDTTLRNSDTVYKNAANAHPSKVGQRMIMKPYSLHLEIKMCKIY